MRALSITALAELGAISPLSPHAAHYQLNQSYNSAMDEALQKVSQLISEYAVQELQKQFERIKQTPGETEFLNESQPHLTRNN